MSTSSASLNNLADLSLARIFVFLPPNERVLVERVCKKWQKIAKKDAWTEFRTLAPDWMELLLRDDLARAKYRALIKRCAPYLRELSLPGMGQFNVEVQQWAKMRNLRHLRFDDFVSAETLHVVAENLKKGHLKGLQSIYLSSIDRHAVTALRDLLCDNNVKLQALSLPMSEFYGNSWLLPAFPSSLRSLNIIGFFCETQYTDSDDSDAENGYDAAAYEWKYERIDELLELAASCCSRQLAMLMLPMHVAVSKTSLTKLDQFENISYLRLCFDLSDANLFGNSLAKIGTHLEALLLEAVDSKVLHLIAEHCPHLKHCYFNIIDEGEGLLSGLQSVFQLAQLCSVSICYRYYFHCELRTQFFAAFDGLNAKGNLKYLHLSYELSMSVEFILNLIQCNPNLHKVTCKIQKTSTELDKLKKLLQNVNGPLELELFGNLGDLPELEMGANNRIRVRTNFLSERISQPMLRHFWAHATDSVPILEDLDC